MSEKLTIFKKTAMVESFHFLEWRKFCGHNFFPIYEQNQSNIFGWNPNIFNFKLPNREDFKRKPGFDPITFTFSEILNYCNILAGKFT